MNRVLPVSSWKAAVAGACLLVLFLWQAEFRHRLQALDGAHATLGIVFDGVVDTPVGRATHLLRVRAVAPESPAAGLLSPGMLVRFDRPLDPWRRCRPGEAVGLQVAADAGLRALRLAAAPVPVAPADAADSLARLLLVVPALGFCLALAFKGACHDAHRALSMCFLAMSLNMFIGFNYLPAGILHDAGKLADLGCYPLSWYLCVRFALRYQPYRASALRQWLERVFPLYRVAAFACAAYALWFSAGFEAPGLDVLTLSVVGGGVALSAASLGEGIGQSTGEMRQRHRWLLLSIMTGAVPAMLAAVPGLDAPGPFGLRLAVFACYTGLLLMYLGLAYGVLRHRVFNFRFAIGRALVYSVLSTLLLCCVGLAEWLAAPLLNDPGSLARRLGIASAAIALLTYLGFHLVHHKLEHWIERLLFRRWHEKERTLRDFVRRAAHITAQDTLLSSFVAALDDFTAGAGAAIYLPAGDGSYRRAACSLAGAPVLLAPGADQRAAWRGAAQAVQANGVAGILPGQLVLPVSHRGHLNGVVVVGSRADAESYRPDECALMAFAARQVGLDLDALRLEQLEQQLDDLTRESGRQNLAQHMLAGRRAAPRGAAASTLSTRADSA
jgi:hypothetical protein